MKSLYRRYRPLTLDEVALQEQVTKPLKAALKAGRVSHAYLFIGPRGCGKTSVARILAHEVNGFKYELEDSYVDIIEIDGASNRGIDNIRELREKVAIAPTSGKYKVYIIDEVHMLTKEAFNALLKTLEEPPAHAIFIMATTDAYKVPITITSRAQTYTFNLATTEEMTKYLRTICDKEKIQITDEALTLIAKKGGGSFRDSLSLLDQISTLSDKEITKDMVIKALGLPEDEKISALLSAYQSSDINAITTTLKELLSAGIKPETLAEEIINIIIDKPEPSLLPLLKTLPEVKAPYAEAKMIVALASKSLFSDVGLEDSRRSSVAKPIHSGVGLENSGMSYAGRPGEPPATQANLSASSGIYIPEFSNQTFIRPNEQVLATDDSPQASPVEFSWEGFVQKVEELSDAVHSQLIKCGHEFTDDTLHLYPKRRIVRTILSRDNNKKILFDAVTSGVKITIHDIDDAPDTSKNDGTLSQISAIMGGEVINDGGSSPF